MFPPARSIARGHVSAAVGSTTISWMNLLTNELNHMEGRKRRSRIGYSRLGATAVFTAGAADLPFSIFCGLPRECVVHARTAGRLHSFVRAAGVSSEPAAKFPARDQTLHAADVCPCTVRRVVGGRKAPSSHASTPSIPAVSIAFGGIKRQPGRIRPSWGWLARTWHAMRGGQAGAERRAAQKKIREARYKVRRPPIPFSRRPRG